MPQHYNLAVGSYNLSEKKGIEKTGNRVLSNLVSCETKVSDNSDQWVECRYKTSLHKAHFLQKQVKQHHSMFV